MSEVDLANDLGVCRETVKKIRNRILKLGEDYERGQHNRVVYLPSGIRKISQELIPEEYEGDVKEPVKYEGKVTNWRFRNKRIVEVDGRHIVRVKNADLYMPNGRSELCPIRFKENANGFIVHGPAPRKAGYWK